MDPVMIILVCVIGLLLIGVIVSLAKTSKGKKSAPNAEKAAEETKKEEELFSEVKEEIPAAPAEAETAADAPCEEAPQEEERAAEAETVADEAPVKETAEMEESAPSIEVAAAVVSEREPRGFEKIPKGEPKKPFYERILLSDEDVRRYFDEIHNEFKSYRNVNARVSKGYDSFRKNRALVARLYLSGKTLKLYLRLDASAYENTKYHQQYAGDKKTYAEIPMMVKIKSARGLANAKTLIADLMKNEGAEKKSRYTKVDYIETLKALMEND
ncbi:MAG: hypothetical protein DBX59_08590 [Bacillota bacterium]|nr:MAG: hypothetical protein DBX59_08590 [Bacillota bacterium]